MYFLFPEFNEGIYKDAYPTGTSSLVSSEIQLSSLKLFSQAISRQLISTWAVL